MEIMVCALSGCGPRLKIDTGTKLSATLWAMPNDLMGKSITVQDDKPAQDALDKNSCMLIVPVQWDSRQKLYVSDKAILSCENQDLVEFPARFVDAEGHAGVNNLAIGNTITVISTAPFTAKLSQ